jgi:hypothetical protein
MSKSPNTSRPNLTLVSEDSGSAADTSLQHARQAVKRHELHDAVFSDQGPQPPTATPDSPPRSTQYEPRASAPSRAAVKISRNVRPPSIRTGLDHAVHEIFGPEGLRERESMSKSTEQDQEQAKRASLMAKVLKLQREEAGKLQQKVFPLPKKPKPTGKQD